MNYQHISDQQVQLVRKYTTKKNAVSLLRVLFLGGAFYFFYLMMYERQVNYAYVAIALLLCFIVSVSMYLKIQSKVNYHKALQQINDQELAFLKGSHRFDAGREFINSQHPFSYDLDVFGADSIFEFLNRTSTSLGKEQLAHDLQQIPDKTIIKKRQEAIQELQTKTDFVQHFQALALLAHTTQQQDAAIQKWTQTSSLPLPAYRKFLALALPVLFVIALIASFLSGHPVFSKLSMLFFTLNLVHVVSMVGLIQKEIGSADKIAESLQHYAHMIQSFHQQSFQSHYLQNIQKQLSGLQKPANQALNELAQLFEKLNTIANLFIFIAFNGVFQYHFWSYQKMLTWKNDYQKEMWAWIQVIGKVEALTSFSVFAQNNPNYIYPIVDKEELIFEQLGHPLIPKEKRVRNSIDFSHKSFVVLTGSNMSGKSTFLRTVGINLVLSYSGAPIDAQRASVFPMPLWVSMRLTDSLSDSESYFFAEVKRLKQIVDQAQKQPLFVLLDEILKGTNSDDKKTGTIGVIERLQLYATVGMIATHDLEVCQTTYKYPERMANMRFEVEIINDELHFDYLLKEGICQNKNATFIMKKMDII